MRTQKSVSLPDEGRSDDSPLRWRWPAPPASMRVYDKYSDREAVLNLGEPRWTIPKQGRYDTATFADDPFERELQQMLTMWSQASNSPSSICSFLHGLTNRWDLCKKFLAGGPDGIKRQWKTADLNYASATVNKAVLKLACELAVGPWEPKHLPLIRGLATHAQPAPNAHIRRREKLIPIDSQAIVTRVLDERMDDLDMKESHAEGLTALALMYQHGVRPVQLLALNVDHIQLLRDVSDDLVCIVSFHSAKQRKSKEFEMPRQVRPEWVPAIAKLHAYALAAGRKRLFAITSSQEVWTRVKRLCLVHADRAPEFTAGGLRHTSAQALADAGHDRNSIQNFLGHRGIGAANAYVKASRQQGELVNRALGASKLYGRILSLAAGEYVSVEQMLQSPEEQQIAGVVGDRLVAGIGLCRTGQPNCNYNPVSSCYGCGKFIPSNDRAAHEEAVAGMRTQVGLYLGEAGLDPSPASLQLMRALSGAQQAIASLQAREAGK